MSPSASSSSYPPHMPQFGEPNTSLTASPGSPLILPGPGYDAATLSQIEKTTGYRLCDPTQLAGERLPQYTDREQRQLKSVMRWVRAFIMRPHPKLGRPGVVCPYVKLSLEASIFYLSLATLDNPRRYDEIYLLLNTHADIFAQMQPHSGPWENLRVLMLLVPNGKDHVLSHPEASKHLKTQMMQRNVTIGQFFPTWHPIRALKSKFFPNQPPLCLYTMRPFIRSDWMFIKGEPEWQAVYLEKFRHPPDSRQGFTL